MTDIERVRALCQERKIPVSHVEKALGFSNGYLNPKKAKTISYDRMVKIAAYLDVPISKIFMGDPTVEETKIPDPVRVEDEQFIQLYQAAPQWLKDQVRALLKAAAAGDGAPGADSTEP